MVEVVNCLCHVLRIVVEKITTVDDVWEVAPRHWNCFRVNFPCNDLPQWAEELLQRQRSCCNAIETRQDDDAVTQHVSCVGHQRHWWRFVCCVLLCGVVGCPSRRTERDPVLSLFLVFGPTLVPLITAPRTLLVLLPLVLGVVVRRPRTGLGSLVLGLLLVPTLLLTTIRMRSRLAVLALAFGIDLRVGFATELGILNDVDGFTSHAFGEGIIISLGGAHCFLPGASTT